MRPATVVVLASTAFVLLLHGSKSAVDSAADYNYLPRIKQGLKISPVKMNLKGKNKNLAGLGSYIVNAQGACTECHTNPAFLPGGNPFLGEKAIPNKAGFLGGGLPFPPTPFVSPNLTPDSQGLPAGLTYEEFRERIQTGITDRHPMLGPIMQVMPWPEYAQMREYDLRAVYEYLRSIPSVKSGS
jgi:hypothetical protein